MEIRETFMNRIKDLREDRDMRQTDLAKATGIDQRTISNYETGKSSPDGYALIKLADFFDVSIDYLLGRVNYDFYNKESKARLIDEIIDLLNDLKKDV